MKVALLSYPHDGRKCRHLINALLKSQSASEIHRLNYVKKYILDNEGNITKQEQKLLLIHTDVPDRLIQMLSKQAPQAILTRVDHHIL